MEEKLEAVVDVVVNDHIPDDIAFSILSKLPIKSLKRFGCVCKSWSLLFENPHFMSMYRNNFADTSLLLKQDFSGKELDYHCPLYLLLGERFENRVSLNLPPQFQDRAFTFHVVGSSANGIFCLFQGGLKNTTLWNPATGEFKVVPLSPVEFESPYRQPFFDIKGFGYDHVRDDYKLIRCMAFLERTEEELDRLHVPHAGPGDLKNISWEPMWEIYSLRSDSWKKLDCEMPIDFFHASNGVQLYTAGMCHWWGTNGNRLVSCLVSFDLSNEVFFTTNMPSYMADANFNLHRIRLQLAEINGFVAIISNYAEKTTIEVSILGEVGVKESWTKLFTVGPLPCIAHLIGMGKKGDIFFRKKNGELAWFDWSTNMTVDIGVKGSKHCCQIVTYKENSESLISFGFEK